MVQIDQLWRHNIFSHIDYYWDHLKNRPKGFKVYKEEIDRKLNRKELVM